MPEYGTDLAAIHDAGFGDFARRASAGVLAALRAARIRSGLVVDLGCGSGILAARLLRDGYDVLGIDASAAMLRIARRRAPSAKFRRASFVDARLPPCVAVTAVGECLNYTFDRRARQAALAHTFARVGEALVPGGLFLFDLLGPVPHGRKPRAFRSQGRNWMVLGQVTEDSRRGVLTRAITTFRKIGSRTRRTDEVHRLRLRAPAKVRAQLEAAGFEVRLRRGYTRALLPQGHRVYFARKLPAPRPRG